MPTLCQTQCGKILAQDLNYFVFGVNKDGDADAKGAIRIRRILIIADNNEPLHDFRAASKNGEGGLVDLVTGEFRGNIAEGANSFLYGPEIETGAGSLTIATDPKNLPVALQLAAGTVDTLEMGATITVSAPALRHPAALRHDGERLGLPWRRPGLERLGAGHAMFDQLEPRDHLLGRRRRRDVGQFHF